MKTNYIQQEVLLMMGTTFSAKQCFGKNGGGQDNLSEKENLQEACWNGLLPEMIPEICEPIEGNKKLFLWKIKEGNSFIELELGEVPEEKDDRFSIDPYAFLHLQLLS